MNAAHYITTPIYYLNARPHIGSAYTSIAADVLSRFYRLQGDDVFFLTGTDEHGQKVEKSAIAAGQTPQEFVDALAEEFKQMTPALNLTPDCFIRTTEPRHKQAAQAIWQHLVAQGAIYKDAYKGWYSVRDETYFDESELVDGKAPTGSDVEWVEEACYFFKLSHFQKPLLEYYKKHPDFIKPKSRYNEVLRFVEGGLKDLCISRSTFRWGIPVPDDEKHVMYVWLDALTNYLTALDFPHATAPNMQKFWPEALHLVGKDILRHHAIYWPAFLLAAQLPLPKRIFAHGWIVVDGQKMSKSLGNTIDPFTFAEQYGADALRYFLMREVPFGRDGNFTMAAFQHRINSDLANDVGNLAQRVLAFIQKNAGAVMPPCHALQAEDHTILEQLQALPKLMYAHATQQEIHKMAEAVITLAQAANRYIDSQQPWALRKNDLQRMETVLNVLLTVLRAIAICLIPFVPAAALKLWHLLGQTQDPCFAALDKPLLSGTALPKPEIIFPKVEYVD